MSAVSRIVNMGSHARKVGFLCLIILLGVGGSASELPATSPEKKSGDVFKNLKVLNNAPSDLLLPSMQFITSSLGVHCEYCHVENAFEKDDKKTKQIARQMMLMMEKINKTEFRDKQEVTCYSCHRGSPKPLTIPVIAGVPQRLLSQPLLDIPSGVQNQPSPADIATKYINARGGTNAIANMSSLEEHGAFHSDSLEFPVEFYATKSAHSAAVIHFSGADRITAFDGSSGWIALPGRPTRAMTPGEADAVRIDSNLLFAPDLNRIFPEIKLTGIAKVGGEDAFVLAGRRPEFPPVEMYFGANSGLLLRVVHYLPAALGLNPTQTDYSDYREIDGVKIPFYWTATTPTGSFTIQIKSARANQDIPGKVFSMPAGK